jgi:hypothetical protein
MKSAARQSIIVPTLMLSAWLLFRLTAHGGGEEPFLARSVPSPPSFGAAEDHFLSPPAKASPVNSHAILRESVIPTGLKLSSPWPLTDRKGSPAPENGITPDSSIAQAQDEKSRRTMAPQFQLKHESPLAQQLPEATEDSIIALQAPFEPQYQAKPALYREARLTGAGWMFFRSKSDGVSSGGAPTLGGSQIGLRLNHTVLRLNDISIGGTVRASAPLGAVVGKEVSAGLTINPGRLPGLRLFLERRIPIDDGGRPAWSALASYGHETTIGQVNLKARIYAEAGAVQSRQTNPFAYARLELAKPVSKHLEIGVETVADAQRDAYRLDIGPVIALREFSDPNIVISAAWRLRASGNARPKSGPAITVSTSF